MIELYTDGSSRNNIIGWAFFVMPYQVTGKGSGYGTNNMAELIAVKHGIDFVLDNYQDRNLAIFSDSKIVLGWISGGTGCWVSSAARIVSDVKNSLYCFSVDFRYESIKGPGHIQYVDAIARREMEKFSEEMK